MKRVIDMKIGKRLIALVLLFACSSFFCGCDKSNEGNNADGKENTTEVVTEVATSLPVAISNQTVTVFDSKMKAISFSGNYGFDKFLKQGGASSDTDVAEFLSKNFLVPLKSVSIDGNCSAISVCDENGNYIFGRNFDWYKCNAMVVKVSPEEGYKSVSTVNTDFIKFDGTTSFNRLSDNNKALLCAYAPLDGMNEEGLAVSLSVIEDSDTINQNNKKTDITPTTAVRLMLDKCASVSEALKLLREYDMHSDKMVHIFISDIFGKSVSVEYIDGTMIATDTPVFTDFFLSDYGKYGVGSMESIARYEKLLNTVKYYKSMNDDAVKTALEDVDQGNYSGGQTTEWSVVYNQTKGVAYYYHEENFANSYTITLN